MLTNISLLISSVSPDLLCISLSPLSRSPVYQSPVISWRNLRRVAAVQLLSAHRVACMSPSSPPRCTPWCGGWTTPPPAVLALAQRPHVAGTKTSRTEAKSDTDMSPEVNEFKQIADQFIPLVSTVNRWDFLPALRWDFMSN
ncbi:hypothetical protein HU200_004331 [Digitaria exilis]|uniref:Uncharacterized protein n=1 Tax=Digitaria exilis TaxID=1010633 RepID=A0A835FTK6_9POAL|nr:hypothetical protein HU200_004331 [Digitaria exilis]